jgi:transcriptional regulator with XRE-family HTH domain
MGINPTTITKIVKKSCREKGLSLNKLALSLGLNPVYLNNVLHGRKVSRPLIRKIAEVLHLPDLPTQYETYLASRRVENKGNKTTSTQKSSKNSKKPTRRR